MRKLFIYAGVCVVLLSCRSWGRKSEDNVTVTEDSEIASTCVYRAIPGTAEVTAVAAIEQDDLNQVEVSFKFTPTTADKDVPNRQWILRYGDGELPCKNWADQNKVTVGQKTPVILEKLTEGDCEAFVFDYYPSAWDFESWYEICQ